MKKVCMYTINSLFGTNDTGGIKRFRELYTGLTGAGVHVDLFCSDPSDVLEKNGLLAAHSIVKTETSKHLFFPTEIKLLMRNFRLIRKIKKTRYDRVILFDVPTAIGFTLLGVKKIQLFIRQDLIGYKAITARERINNKILFKLYLRFLWFCEALCLISAQRIIMQCDYDLNIINNRHKLLKFMTKNKTIIQINNVDPSWIVKQSADTAGYKLECARIIDSELFMVGYVGDFSSERKGHRIFLEAIKKIIESGKKVCALVIGDGCYLPEVKQELACFENIVFTGRIQNPIAIIQKCDLAVVPSLADSCPNTIMEALYNNVPVIASNAGGIPEILNDHSALFEPIAASLKERILFFMDKNKLSSLQDRQVKRKKELQFDWPGAIRKHLDL